jgi:hypothetical protein
MGLLLSSGKSFSGGGGRKRRQAGEIVLLDNARRLPVARLVEGLLVQGRALAPTAIDVISGGGGGFMVARGPRRGGVIIAVVAAIVLVRIVPLQRGVAAAGLHGLAQMERD